MPRAVIGMAPIFAQASFQERLRLGSAVTRHLAALRFEILRACVQRRCDFREELRRAHSTAARRVDEVTPPTVVLPPEPPETGYVLSPIEQVDLVDRNAERFGGDHQDDGARAGAEILRAHLDFDCAIGMNGEIAIARVTASAPGVHGEAKSPLDRARRFCRRADASFFFQPISSSALANSSV